MNKSALKKYAPQARKDFIAAVTRRAQKLGLNPNRPAKVERSGDVLLIDGQPYPAAWAPLRERLQARIKDQGFEQVMDAMAYTWFNRLVAVRYMELHGFLDHGYRVLSHPANKETGHTQPEILDHIAELVLPGLNKSRALDLKLAGNRDEELYCEVLLAQCHALHAAMPFLFESLDDATELLLPDGLLRTDSIVGQLVTAIDEADWRDVEIIGWLYQFYISDEKARIDDKLKKGKVVESSEIPAKTQLFTPNWIVKYLVQNSLGRLWLMANPTSSLATKWDYYIKPAEQTPEVNAQLDALIQARIAEDGTSLNPESLTLLDPACGSGHILVEAYDLLRDIYLERGYRRQDIPRLILEKNLYGLDIDDRAAQLAGFALLMKARADDRRLFGQPVPLNVLALQEAKKGGAADLHSALNAPQISYAVVSQLVETFEQAKTFGSLIQVPDELTRALPALRPDLEAVRDGGDLLGRDAAQTLLRLVTQAEALAKQFDAVAANPPYMGGKGMNAELKAWAKKIFPASKSDLFAMFIERGFGWCKPAGFNSMVTMQSWMFLSSLEELRTKLLDERSLVCMEHMGNGVMGIAFGTSAAVFLKAHANGYVSSFGYCESSDIDETGAPGAFPIDNDRNRDVCVSAFRAVSGSPIAYWVDPVNFRCFEWGETVGDHMHLIQGMITGDNDRYLRYWHEISAKTFSIFTGRSSCWVPYNKGGEALKWYGNHDFVVDWRGSGQGFTRNRSTNSQLYFRPYVSWSYLNSGGTAARYYPEGFLWDVHGSGAFPKSEDDAFALVSLLCSSTGEYLLRILNPTMSFQVENIAALPWKDGGIPTNVVRDSRRMVEYAKSLWDEHECSWNFLSPPVLKHIRAERLGKSVDAMRAAHAERSSDMELIRKCIDDAIKLAYELEIPESKSPKEQDERDNDGALEGGALVSYTVGCMMGRYSLDAPGLIYAHAGNEGFDPSRYETFPADDDGIVPITDEAWFDDDGANRIREFVRVVWGEGTEAENMAWLAESLGSKASESADDTIRRYLSRDFYKDHLQTYKKRPIYWLFSSGKHKAFEALVYLHRYNAGTLARMRMEYVVPLQSRMQGRIDSLEQDINAATSSAETKRLQKQRDKLIKQVEELRCFDETLRHYADQRITLDLDDGVKVNYGKFGDLLAEVNTVTGGASDD